ncbi:GntR family transcriptional regulator [Rhodococcus globerulus]|uniref:GntR family transcriptional regulator n=1 Tax=Rhodococcus globerulus TaxID=33008 RepID=A0ABU4C3C9_RHOGO|nr:GntR family transcriptional regulator [Rhodococcus globerulus]MDV6270804.1 GntR family transcriptional regulator [Rhodococcus globerulus]
MTKEGEPMDHAFNDQLPIRYGLPSRSTTGEQVAELIRQGIMSGDIRHSSPLREEAIAAQFEVSRRTVRDALRILEGFGLVRHQRHKGTQVADFTTADIVDLYNTRLVLETAAAQRWCTATPTDADDLLCEQLNAAFERLRTASEQHDAVRVVEADLGFHAAVVGLLASPRADRFFGSMAQEMVFAIAILEAKQRETETRPVEALAEHDAIRRALTDRDRARALRLINDHASTNRDRLVSIIDDSQG